MVHNKRKLPNIKHESIYKDHLKLWLEGMKSLTYVYVRTSVRRVRLVLRFQAVDFIVPDYISSSFLISCYSMAPITFQILKQLGMYPHFLAFNVLLSFDLTPFEFNDKKEVWTPESQAAVQLKDIPFPLLSIIPNLFSFTLQIIALSSNNYKPYEPGRHNIISIKVQSFNPDTMLKKSFHHRNGSGELDVFEAARYFSGYNEAASYNCGTLISQKVTRDERQPLKGDRISLDVAMRRNPLLHQSHLVEKHAKEKKHKQPSSPGGKLATFLNSLFNQTGSKKKKNSKSTTQSMKDEEVSPGGRRKRRISISHFRSSNTVDTKSFYSSSSSGFRTPPPYTATPTKRNETSKLIDGFLEKYKNIEPHHQDKNMNIRVDRYQSEEKDFSKLCEVDDGADSDSSSDLFELQSYSSGLPVFETTNMDSFKRGAPISNGAL
ncbi:hypothetical protein Golax_025605 [Gossypium laxum]|uniref:Uncharacterized protein n=1 Tax=Gossypium laxum TaxID=34288 RepID=A0A7J9AZE2_9ROSI|nr:hypothetical protein [Gossypium laxum]